MFHVDRTIRFVKPNVPFAGSRFWIFLNWKKKFRRNESNVLCESKLRYTNRKLERPTEALNLMVFSLHFEGSLIAVTSNFDYINFWVFYRRIKGEIRSMIKGEQRVSWTSRCIKNDDLSVNNRYRSTDRTRGAARR